MSITYPSISVKNLTQISRSTPRWIEIYLIMGVILIPIHRIILPGNTIIFDWLNFVFLLPACFFILFRRKKPIRLALVLPGWLILIGSLFGMMASPTIQPSILALAKEFYLYIWFLLLINLFDDPRLVRNLLIAWTVVATLQSLLVIAQFMFPALLSAMTSNFHHWGEGGYARPLGTFKNPNLTASYLSTSVYLFILSSYWQKKAGVLIFFFMMAGIFSTGSRAALYSILIGLVIAYCANFAQSTRKVKWLRQIIMIAVILFAITFSISSIREEIGAKSIISSRLSLNKNAIDGGLDITKDVRLNIWEEGIQTFLEHPFGVGVGMFLYNGRAKMLHNSFLSFLIERGLLGLAGYLLWIFIVLNELMVYTRLQRRMHKSFWVGIILLGGFISSLVFSMAHESFHFRSTWFFIALIFGALNAGGFEERVKLPKS